MKNNILKKFFYFSIGSYLNIILGIVFTPMITRLYSPKVYGEYTLILAIVSLLLNIGMLGLDQGISRFYYEEKEKNKLFQSSIIYSSICYFLIAIIIIFFKNELNYFLLGQSNEDTIKIILLSLFFYIIYKYGMLFIQLEQNSKLYSLLNILSKLIEVFFIIIFFLYYGDNYRGLLYGVMLSITLIGIIVFYLKRKILYGNMFQIEKINKKLLKYSFPLMITTILNWLLSNSDKFVLKLYTSIEKVGIYTGAFKLVTILMLLHSSFLIFWIPISFENYSKNKENLYFFEKVNEYVSLIMFIIGGIIILLKEYIIIFLGKEYKEAITIFPILVLIPITLMIGETTSLGISFKNKTKYLTFISLITVILNLLFLFIVVEKKGIIGVSIVTTITYIILFILKTYYSIKLVNFKFSLIKMGVGILLLFTYSLSILIFNYNSNILIIGIILIIIIIYKNTICNLLKELKEYLGEDR